MTTDIRLGPDGIARCAWVGDDREYRRYHDEEWGFPLHGDRALFEKMSLEGFQAGLSWITILRKRPRFREVFAGFEPEAVAAFGEADVENPGDGENPIRVPGARHRDAHAGRVDPHEVTDGNAGFLGQALADRDVPALAVLVGLTEIAETAGNETLADRRHARFQRQIDAAHRDGVEALTDPE